jgi:hypothetical protein
MQRLPSLQAVIVSVLGQLAFAGVDASTQTDIAPA